jgi:tetratricopeptide (TPR) repeat protein
MANEAPSSCANCGKGEEFEAKLKTCTACKLVKYCGKDCQVAHRSLHKKACKKRAAELHDETLFRQPPKADDCPICFLPLPALISGEAFMACCGKTLCIGCHHEHKQQSNGSPTCPFCRAAMPSAKEYIKMLGKRVDVNDSKATYELGYVYYDVDEQLSVEKDVDKAVELFHRAADLGSAEAYHDLGVMYADGDGVIKDETKAKHYFEKAAIRGCQKSRFNLGCIDADAGGFDRAIKHWLIAASCGEIGAVDCIKRAMNIGEATKDHYAQALRGYLLWRDEVKSDHRIRAAAYSDDYDFF